eukprot:TRINITY_DN6656_c0_g1_i1.p1 TRINITY_DN6656_c0_g1~~TRINITY_DN6656_c0_g1_i1.p1  ORF type:complete len:178 (+),score=69.03 TRINITY_DN6656_c0_g1_i1:7-540(+)
MSYRRSYQTETKVPVLWPEYEVPKRPRITERQLISVNKSINLIDLSKESYMYRYSEKDVKDLIKIQPEKMIEREKITNLLKEANKGNVLPTILFEEQENIKRQKFDVNKYTDDVVGFEDEEFEEEDFNLDDDLNDSINFKPPSDDDRFDFDDKEFFHGMETGDTSDDSDNDDLDSYF